MAKLIKLLNDITGGEKCHLFIPHIGYRPFEILANQEIFEKVSFYQESIQIPKEMICERESKLLRNGSGCTSLYTTNIRRLNSRLTKDFYMINDEICPLHLKKKNIELGNILEENGEGEKLESIDIMIAAGKALNSVVGIKLMEAILNIVMSIREGDIVCLKASPSSTNEVKEWMKMKEKESKRIIYVSGETNVDEMVMKSKKMIIETELFKFAGIYQRKNMKNNIISKEKTIIKDYIKYQAALNDRINNKFFRRELEKFNSLSEWVKQELSN